MGQTLRVIAGSDGGPWTSTLLDSTGLPIAYPSDAGFIATVSRGGEEASLFTPTVAWVDSSAGTFTVATSAAQTAALDPGTYDLQVFVTSGGLAHEAFDGRLEVLPTVGTTAGVIPWCSARDMLSRCDQIATLHRKGVDSTGFLNERVIATEIRRRMILDRYKPQPGRVDVRQNNLDPIAGFDVPSATAVAPSKAIVTTALDTPGGLILESTIREIVARDAIALVLMRQATGGNAPAYMNEAQMQSDRADKLFRCYKAQIDTNLDGTADALIDRDAILLPPGTSP